MGDKLKKLYICDGKACRKDRMNCYLEGGYCFYTEKANHSISMNDPAFPPTSSYLDGDTLFEVIDLGKFMHDYGVRKLYRD